MTEILDRFSRYARERGCARGQITKKIGPISSVIIKMASFYSIYSTVALAKIQQLSNSIILFANESITFSAIAQL